MLHERVGVKVSAEHEEIGGTRRTTIAKLERSVLCSIVEELDCMIQDGILVSAGATRMQRTLWTLAIPGMISRMRANANVETIEANLLDEEGRTR